MTDAEITPDAPAIVESAVQWEKEHQGFLTIIATAHGDKDIYTAQDILERIAPTPETDAPHVNMRERMMGDVSVVDVEVFDPKTKQLSNTDGPAVVKADGTRMWYRNGMLHNAAGPAVIRPNGKLEYHYLGTKCADAAELDAIVERSKKHAQRSKTFKTAITPNP